MWLARLGYQFTHRRGSLAQGDRYGRALMLLLVFSLLMVLVNLMLRPVLRTPVTV